MARNTSSSPAENDNATDTSMATSSAGGAAADNAGQVIPGDSPAMDVGAVDANVITATSVQASDNSIMIYPLRSYLDGKEIRRRGGAGYLSPKHDAISLIAAGLATDKDPKA
jgi:hypothetical protein